MRYRAATIFLVMAGAMFGLAGCGGSDLTLGATPTASVASTATATRTGQPTGTATPRPTQTQTPIRAAQVAGLVVVGADVGRGSEDGLAPLRPTNLPPLGKGFDRALGAADWVVDDGAAEGTTGDDGRFSVSGLAPGRHVLHFTKTVDGNLMQFVVPIIVGDDGAAEVLAEVSWGLVRATSNYIQGGAATRAVFSPNGAYLITRGGAAVELFDGWRTLVDGDGDGRFDAPGCGGQLYACRDDGSCAGSEDICLCVPSCPDCGDCATRACVPRAYLRDPACGPDGLCKRLPYACDKGSDTCAKTGDQCSCIASCPVCDDCLGSACVAPCTGTGAIEVSGLTVYAADRVVVGRESSASATLRLSDGSGVDVTWLADWASSAPAVAAIDSWARIAPLVPGATGLSATLLGVTSDPVTLTVVERPTLVELILQNASCRYPTVDPRTPVEAPLPPTDAPLLPSPWCTQVLRVGGTLPVFVVGRYDDGSYEDVTGSVTWRVEPAAVGAVADGVFTAAQVGAASLVASLSGIDSNALALKVVDKPTLVELSVYPADWAPQYLEGGPVRPDGSVCLACGYSLTLLRGDAVRFSATAHYDTGEWKDVSADVQWASSDGAVLSIDAAGVGTAEGAGEAMITATLDDVTSGPLSLRVVNEATLQNLSVYQETSDRVIGVGGEMRYHAIAYYDVGFQRDVTAQAVWRSSDPAVASFDTPGVLTGRGAGTVSAWAEVDGQASAPLSLEVFAQSGIDYCDATQVNRSEWADDFNRVTLESDCATYTAPDVVALRFTVTETQPRGGVFDPCLDLYAYRGDALVRTIRSEGCGDPFVAPAAPARDEAVLKYQLKAFWDLKDDAGATVPPGAYTIHGRFYLYYDPVVSLRITVAEDAAQ